MSKEICKHGQDPLYCKKCHPSQKKEAKTIKVDKDFLMEVLKLVQDVRKEVVDLKQGTFKPKGTPLEPKEAPLIPKIVPKTDYIFQCFPTVSIDKIPSKPEDIIYHTQRSEEFRKKLETLMKEYKVVQSTAMFLKKL